MIPLNFNKNRSDQCHKHQQEITMDFNRSHSVQLVSQILAVEKIITNKYHLLEMMNGNHNQQEVNNHKLH